MDENGCKFKRKKKKKKQKKKKGGNKIKQNPILFLKNIPFPKTKMYTPPLPTLSS